MYQRGDRVRVEGLGGKQATLRVWEARPRGLILCSETEYEEALRTGRTVSALGFPMCDIRSRDETTPQGGYVTHP